MPSIVIVSLINQEWSCKHPVITQTTIRFCKKCSGTKSMLVVGAVMQSFYNHYNKSFSGRPILRLGATPREMIFVISSCFADLCDKRN